MMFLDLRKDKNYGKNTKIETDVARAKGMYDKIDNFMTKF